MPELPEVETVARLIRPDLLGRRVRSAEVFWRNSSGGLDSKRLSARLSGKRVRAVERRGKYILIEFVRAGAIAVHLRMSGRLQKGEGKPGPYVRVRLNLDRGTLDFIDVRKFGRFVAIDDSAAFLAHLGPEPLGPEFTEDWFIDALRRRRGRLKPLLLDQEFVAGLGNIYVDESLHRAGLHPLRSAASVRRPQARRLHSEIRAVLSEAIEREGSSFDTFYRTPTGQPGQYQHQFQVYARDGQDCLRCGTKIIKLVVGQRGTHVCSRCQRKPR